MTETRHLRATPLHAHIWDREPQGHYVEPFWRSERLFEEEHFGPASSLVFDPAAGRGRILQSAAAAGYTAVGADIVDRLDRKALGPVAFCERALEIATFKVAMLVPLRRLPAARWLEHLPLETVWLLTPRPSMPPGSYIAAGHKPGGGSQDFCWLVFRKGLFAWTPRLRWLHRDSETTTTITTTTEVLS